MIDFIKVDDINCIKLTNRWTNSKKFLSEGRFINKNNEFVKVSYPGTLYLVVMKKERAFTSIEKVGRLTKFLFFSLLTLGLCNLNKGYSKLWTKDKMVCRYAVRFNLPKVDLKDIHAKIKKLDVIIDPKSSTKQKDEPEDLQASYVRMSD